MSHKIMMGLLTALAMGLSAPAALAGVDPALLALVMPDAKMLVGIQVSQAQASPVGRFLLSQLQLDENANKAMTAAGFDLHRDLREILAAYGDGSNVLLLGRGSFQPARISKAAVGAGAVSAMYHGVELLTHPGFTRSFGGGGVRTDPSTSVAFLDASTVAAGDTDAVKALIDRRTAGMVLSAALSEKARQISVGNDAWVASLSPPAALAGAVQSAQLGPFQNLLQAALQLSAGLKFAATQVTLSAEVVARSAQDAQSMADVLKFLIGMMQQDNSSGQNAPNPSKTPWPADAAQVSSNGSIMHLVISIPEQQMEQFLLPDPKRPSSGQPKKIALR
jgi:hypothetical protein